MFIRLINMFFQTFLSKKHLNKKKHESPILSTLGFPLISVQLLPEFSPPDMMRPTRRICRRPPELQAANARAFSKGTPSSRRAFARDTWRKLNNNVLQNEEGWSKKTPEFQCSTQNIIKKNTLHPTLQYWIYFWEIFKHVFPDLQGEASIMFVGKKSELIHFSPTKSQLFFSLMPWGWTRVPTSSNSHSNAATARVGSLNFSRRVGSTDGWVQLFLPSFNVKKDVFCLCFWMFLVPYPFGV